MDAPTTRTLTVEVSERTFQRLQESARRRHQPAGRIVEELLDLSLSSAVTEPEAAWWDLVEKYKDESTPALRDKLQMSLAEAEQRRLAELLAVNRKRDLTADETDELDQLQQRMMEVASERAAATYLLQRTKLQQIKLQRLKRLAK